MGEKLTWLLLMKLQMRHLTTTLTGTPQWKCYGSVSGLPRGLSPMHQDIFRSDCFRCCKESQKGCAEPLTNGSVEEESPLSSGCRRRRQGPCAKPQRHHPPSVQTEGARTWMQVCKACSHGLSKLQSCAFCAWKYTFFKLMVSVGAGTMSPSSLGPLTDLQKAGDGRRCWMSTCCLTTLTGTSQNHTLLLRMRTRGQRCGAQG